MNHIGSHKIKGQTAHEHQNDIRIRANYADETLKICDEYHYRKERERITDEYYEPTIDLLHGFTTYLISILRCYCPEHTTT
jgi:hypothetical protein